MVEGIWSTLAAREEFSDSERSSVVEDYEERGPQLFAGGAGFAYYELPGGRTLILADKNGRVRLPRHLVLVSLCRTPPNR